MSDHSDLVLFNPKCPEELSPHIAIVAGKFGYTNGEGLGVPGDRKVLVHFDLNPPNFSDSSKKHNLYLPPEDLELVRVNTAYQILGIVTRSPDTLIETIRKVSYQGRTPHPDVIQIETPFKTETAAWNYIYSELLPKMPQDKTFTFQVTEVRLITKFKY